MKRSLNLPDYEALIMLIIVNAISLFIIYIVAKLIFKILKNKN
jgi:hypothetical protein